MRSKRPPSEKRAWPNTFLSLVRERYHDYEINLADKYNCTELHRDVEGLLHMQSTYWSNQYHHCFAVSLTLLSPGHLNSPFWAGARFDHNNTIFWAFERDLNAVVRGPNRMHGLHSSHDQRSGFVEIVKQCTTNAELYLAPHYRRTLVAAAPLLLRCIEVVERDPTILTDSARHHHYAPVDRSVDLCAKDFVNHLSTWRDFTVDELPQAIVASAPDKFAPYVDDFANIKSRLNRLV